MLNVLLESKAKRSRRTGGTFASTMIHAALFAAAITVTTRKALPAPLPTEVVDPTVVYRPSEQPRVIPDDNRPRPTEASGPTAPRIPMVSQVPDKIPPVDVDVQVAMPTDDEAARGAITSSSTFLSGVGSPGRAPDGVLEERYVDRPPRILGTPLAPAFPTSLRERGVNGRVSVQFVIDTLGRAEIGGLRIVEATDPLFVQSVRAVLPRYRFSPGEVGGQKVRTLVQLPFDFTLVR
jgi:periplasmic protein TonB